jgi:PAS domain S-box-containing protein
MSTAVTPSSAASPAELELKAVLDTAVDAVVIMDRHGRIEECNRAAERLFGFGVGELTGCDVTVLMPEPHRTRHASYVERYLRTGEPHIIGIGREVGARRKDGTVFPVHLSIGELRIAGDPHFVAFLHDLSERKRVELELMEAHRRAQSYLDLADVILLALDEQGRISMINRKGCEILGRTESELYGEEWVAVCVPESARDAVRKVFRALVREDRVADYGELESLVVTRDGTERLIAWRNRVLRDDAGRVTGTLSSGEDVTARRAVERALNRSQRLLQAAERVARVGDFEVRIPRTGADHMSLAVRRMLGLEDGETPAGQPFTDLVHPDDRERFDRSVAEAADQKVTLDLRYRIVTRGGDLRFVHAIARARHEPDGSLAVTGMLHDVTERQRAEEEIQRTRERLTHVSRLSTMGEMASGLAHEINQPLTAISVYAQACARMLAADADSHRDDLREALDQISAQALRAGEVIRRLRAMVKQRPTARATTDCNDLVRELITLAEPDVRASDIVLRLDLAAEPLPVHVDAVQIQQVLLNLIRNAIDATIASPASPRRIEIRTAACGDEDVELSVIDSGCGLPPDTDRLFDPFFTTKPAGTGLGLSISRSIIRHHGGRLECAPNPAGGAIFTFTLPLTREQTL